MDHPKVYVIIVNYNNWPDTIECLESVLRSDYQNYQVIVVDNSSPNNSMDYIKLWANGNLNIWVNPLNPLRKLTFPGIIKPISYIMYYTKENMALNKCLENNSLNNTTSKYPLILIQSHANGGFAFGNNIAIRYALNKNDFNYIWFLNNDTVVEKATLSNLVSKFEYYRKIGKKIGIVGSKLLFYDDPTLIQGIGGLYNKWFAFTRHLGIYEKDEGQYDNDNVANKIDYPIGASMLVSKDFIEDIGLMCEDYFLYFEELDWVLKGRKKGYSIGYSWDSKVYHKEGASTGLSHSSNKKNGLADYYALRNKILFTKKMYPKYLFTVYLGLFLISLDRIRKRRFAGLKLFFSKGVLNLLKAHKTYLKKNQALY